MINLLLFLSLFYTQYKYTSELPILLEDPVSMSLGGDHTIKMWSPSAALWNPASISSKAIGLSHFSYYDNFIGLENVGISGITSNNYKIAFFLSYLHSKPIELTKLIDSALGIAENNITIVSEQQFFSLSLYSGIKRNINQNLSIGTVFHYTITRLPDYDLRVVGMDAGFLYLPSSNLSFGWKIKNLITSCLENGIKEILRPSIHFTTLAYGEKLGYYFTISSEYDGKKDYSIFTYKNTSIYASLGTEYYLSPNVSIRAGIGRYGMAFGTGIKFNKINVDYAIRPFGDIGIIHKLALYYQID